MISETIFQGVEGRIVEDFHIEHWVNDHPVFQVDGVWYEFKTHKFPVRCIVEDLLDWEGVLNFARDAGIQDHFSAVFDEKNKRTFIFDISEIHIGE